MFLFYHGAWEISDTLITREKGRDNTIKVRPFLLTFLGFVQSFGLGDYISFVPNFEGFVCGELLVGLSDSRNKGCDLLSCVLLPSLLEAL